MKKILKTINSNNEKGGAGEGRSIKERFRTAGTRHGAYSVGLTVLVIAVVIILNLIVGQFPEAFRSIDVSSTGIYDISDTSVELLEGLDREIDMKVLANGLIRYFIRPR